MRSPAAIKLKELRKSARLTVRAVAQHLGYAHGSGYQHFEDNYSKPLLPYDLVESLIPLFVPKGIEARELLRLAGVGFEDKAPTQEVRVLINELRLTLDNEVKPLISKVEELLARLEKATRG